MRAGFAIASTSLAPSLSFENVVSKFKERKKNNSIMLAGADCYSDPQSRTGLRSPFDGDVVTNLETMVCLERLFPKVQRHADFVFSFARKTHSTTPSSISVLVQAALSIQS